MSENQLLDLVIEYLNLNIDGSSHDARRATNIQRQIFIQQNPEIVREALKRQEALREKTEQETLKKRQRSEEIRDANVSMAKQLTVPLILTNAIGEVAWNDKRVVEEFKDRFGNVYDKIETSAEELFARIFNDFGDLPDSRTSLAEFKQALFERYVDREFLLSTTSDEGEFWHVKAKLKWKL